jgi:tetratricopeptide (TPR) repeat protein
MNRRPSRSLAVLVAAIAVAIGSYVAAPLFRAPLSATTRPAAPAVPVHGGIAAVDDPFDPAGVDVAAKPGERLSLEERIAFWAGRVEARPDDFLSLAQLALVHAERARLTADISAYDQALALIDRSTAVVPAYPPTIRARASLRFATHDFAGASADAESVLRAAPDDPTALAVLGDAALELGRPDDAAAAYDRLEATGAGPWLDVRRARLAYVTGDPARAVQLAARAGAAAVRDDPADAGFYAFAHAEYARLAGDAKTARSGYEAALAVRATDLGAIVGLARIDAAAGDVQAAIEGLRRAATIAPQPETLALLGDLLAATGDEAAADEQFATVRLAGTLGDLAGAVYDRQLIAFELDHGGADEATLAAARTSAADRPDAAGHDLVAWALHRLARDDAAAVESDRARATGIVDARILFHAGAIAVSRGDRDEGERLLRQAVALRAALDPIEAAEADALLGGQS